jgi:transposase
MTSRSQPFQHIIAFEVAKNSLTVHVLPAGRQEGIANTPAAVRRVLRRELKFNSKMGLGPILVVCEATGGYERHVLAEAVALGLALHRAHGVRARYFARYLGLAKTDPIDARMLASYGRDTPNLRLYAPPEPQQAALTALRKRQDDLKVMICMEANRLEHARHPGVVASIKASIRMLTKDKERLEDAINQLVRATPQMARKSKLMQSLKGVGPATATACLAYLPELGSFTKGQVARIVGLAPIANDSGKASLPRHIAGGRAVMRQALYMAAVVAITHNDRITSYARSLRQRGKPAKLVITAVMRKLIIILNAILRDGQTAHASKA